MTHRNGRYIVPEWVDPDETSLPPHCLLAAPPAASFTPSPLSASATFASAIAPLDASSCTRLWLPFQPLNDDSWVACSSKFDSLEAETLLFLRRLKRIRFEVRSNAQRGSGSIAATACQSESVREISVVEMECSAVQAAHNKLHPNHTISTKELRDDIAVANSKHTAGTSGGGSTATNVAVNTDSAAAAGGSSLPETSHTKAAVYRLHKRALAVPQAFLSRSSRSGGGSSSQQTSIILGFRLDSTTTVTPPPSSPSAAPVPAEGVPGAPVPASNTAADDGQQDAGVGADQSEPKNAVKEQTGAAGRCSVFAHLPVGSVGLRFIVQASWALVSSRQQLRLDSPWNLWLREQVAVTFAAAIASDADLRDNLGGLLPRAGEVVDPFWTPLVPMIEAALQEQTCLRSESGTYTSPASLLVRPSRSGDAASGSATESSSPASPASGSAPDRIITNAELLRCTGFEFADCSAAAGVSPAQAVRLGARRFTMEHMLQCLNDIVVQDSLLHRPWHWFESMYAFLHMWMRPDDADAVVKIPIFRVAAHTTTAGGIPNGVDLDGTVLNAELFEASFAASAPSTSSMARLADGPIFLHDDSLAEPALRDLAVASGAVRIVAHQANGSTLSAASASPTSPSRVPALFASLGIVRLTPALALECVLSQHLAATFTGTKEVWAGLWLVRTVLPMVRGTPECPPIHRLRTELCIPNNAGALCSPMELHIRSILGVDCPCCDERSSKGNGGHHSHERTCHQHQHHHTPQPLQLYPPERSNSGDGGGNGTGGAGAGAGQTGGAAGDSAGTYNGNVSVSFQRVSGKAVLTSTVQSMPGLKSSWVSGRVSTEDAVREGKVRMEVRIEEPGMYRIGFGHAESGVRLPGLTLSVECPGPCLARLCAYKNEQLRTTDGALSMVKPGDVITIAVDLDLFTAYFAINEKLCSGGGIYRGLPENKALVKFLGEQGGGDGNLASRTSLLAHMFPLPVHLAGMSIVPMLATCGGKATTQFTMPEVKLELLDDQGFMLLGTRRARGGDAVREASLVGAFEHAVASRPSALALGPVNNHLGSSSSSGGGGSSGADGSSGSGSSSGTARIDESGDSASILLEAFLLSIGCRPHYHACVKRHWWSSLSDSVEADCTICMLALAADPDADEDDGHFAPDADNVDVDGAGGVDGGHEGVGMLISTLSCNHRFHADCVAKWFAVSGSNGRCPVCRTTATVVNTCPTSVELTENALSRGFAALSRELGASASNHPQLHGLMREYSAHPFVSALIGSVPVQSTRGLFPLSKVFADCYQPYGEHWLPYIRTPGLELIGHSFLKQFGCSILLDPAGVVAAIETVVHRVQDSRTVTEGGITDLMLSLYGLLDRVLAQAEGSSSASARSAAAAAAASSASEFVKAAFNSKALLHVGNSTFVTADKVYWNGDSLVPAMLNHHVLRGRYPSFKTFFCHRLQIPSVTVAACRLALLKSWKAVGADPRYKFESRRGERLYELVSGHHEDEAPELGDELREFTVPYLRAAEAIQYGNVGGTVGGSKAAGTVSSGGGDAVMHIPTPVVVVGHASGAAANDLTMRHNAQGVAEHQFCLAKIGRCVLVYL